MTVLGVIIERSDGVNKGADREGYRGGFLFNLAVSRP